MKENPQPAIFSSNKMEINLALKEIYKDNLPKTILRYFSIVAKPYNFW